MVAPFLRCFLSKLLACVNGEKTAGAHFTGIDQILATSAEDEYRVVDTIAALVNSPLFRGE